jgi:hypothetical protein
MRRESVPSKTQPSPFEGFRRYAVGEYEYVMTYFEARLPGEGGVPAVAEQFSELVEHWAGEGYEFYRCDEIPYQVAPGPIAALFGAKERAGRCTLVSFRKKR